MRLIIAFCEVIFKLNSKLNKNKQTLNSPTHFDLKKLLLVIVTFTFVRIITILMNLYLFVITII